MAIKNRRGAYADFDPQKMVPGEFAVVLSGDPDTQSGKAVYVCFATGDTIRLATRTDVIQNIATEYSNVETYTKNQLVFHDGILYRSKTAISTPEEWLSTRWERVYISDSLIVPGSGTNAELFNEISTNTASGTSSHAEGRNAKATGNYSHAEGNNTEASGAYAHSEGYSTHATASNYSSHAEGYMSTASGNASHAEGYNTKAIGLYAHSENYLAEARGNYSHAEGYNTIASGYGSHAEGYRTTSTGYYAHADGEYTEATHRSQHVFGTYNELDPSTAVSGRQGTYVEIVGNGTSTSNRSNARTLDWNGNETLAGKLTVGASPVNDMDVATKAYVDSVGSSVAVSYTDPNNDGNIVISMGGL